MERASRFATCFFVSFALIPFSSASASAQATQQALREMVVNRLQATPIIADKPDFQINERVLAYRLGGLKSGKESRSSVDIPVQTQFRVELVRNWKWPEAARRILTPYLDQIEEHVATELSLLSRMGDDNRLFKTLQEHERTTDSLFVEALRRVATSEGRELCPLIPTQRGRSPTPSQDQGINAVPVRSFYLSSYFEPCNPCAPCPPCVPCEAVQLCWSAPKIESAGSAEPEGELCLGETCEITCVPTPSDAILSYVSFNDFWFHSQNNTLHLLERNNKWTAIQTNKKNLVGGGDVIFKGVLPNDQIRFSDRTLIARHGSVPVNVYRKFMIKEP